MSVGLFSLCWIAALGHLLPQLLEHALQCTSAHARAYCVTSGWLNPLLDRLHFFERIERASDRSMRRRMT
ncbi:MAG: hypothetical protein CL933_21230 [Deltaproteobacteria bacterium]|nr:hypothetical protein [Deltaproteobacteria bacterium]